ncbi:prenyltransferase/squalene oxidase repeat-containing protein [Streptomyces niger]|uniref:prenyltransferase/squalene oxidase repeat-containing protein n=1 Tax=Streptomyces niger TaxID=66373 RepID=UPI0006995C7F|nr:prenyltransferase/squalene oxidase repeat-containing protein [Streptomyces niger]
MSPPSLRAFILDHVLDGHGRIPAVLGRDASDVVTADRTLRDAALAALTLGGPHDRPLTARLLDALQEFRDSDADGWHELLDVTGVPHVPGQVRTPADQALAAWACHHAGTALGRADVVADAQAQLRRLTALVPAKGWPARLDRMSTTVLDGASSLAQTAVLVLAAQATDDGSADRSAFLDAAAEHLERFLSEDGAWAYLTPRGEPDTLHGYRLRAGALAALAWAALDERGVESASAYATKVLHHIRTVHPHAGARGFWDRADAGSQVRVDPLSACHGRPGSPFPAKLVADHALLAVAAGKLADLTDDVALKELSEAAGAELDRYTDPQAGGVFQGQGSWFSTPVDPTVPLARHVMVPPRTAGAFAVGNTSYVPFHEKHAETQLLALWAVGDRTPAVPSAPALAEPPAPHPIETDLSRVSTARLSEGLIDLPGYLRWLRSTASGLGYGLTPYRSPLGLRSDRTAQTFSVLHVVSDLMALDEPVPDPEGLLAGVFATQNPDGGFGEQPGLLSEAFTTYCAVLTAKVLGGEGYDRERCVEFLQACQHPEGGFGNAPGYPCDSWHSNLAVLALHALGERPARENDLVAYFVSCRNDDGGYGNQPGSPSDTFATFRVVDTLIALGLRPPRMEQTIEWLRGLQTESGGFRYRAGAPESFVGSYHAIAALYVMGAQPADVPACLAWIAARQSSDGGFSRLPGGPSETTDEGFIAIQALHMLEQKLNPYWAVIMT